MKVTDEQIVWASKNSLSASEASRLLGINYKTYKSRANKLGVYRSNQSGKGIHKNRSRKYTINDSLFDNIDSEDKAYWLGFIAADGSIVDNTLKFMLNEKDSKHLDKFLEFAESDYNIGYCDSHYTDKNGATHYFKSCYLKITSPKIVDSLSKYGIVQGKKYKDINFMQNIPCEYRLNFISGLFDGDGSIGIYDGNCSLTIALNRETCRDIMQDFTNMGIKFSLQRRDNIDVIYLTSLSSISLFYSFYKLSVTLERKDIIFREILNI